MGDEPVRCTTVHLNNEALRAIVLLTLTSLGNQFLEIVLLVGVLFWATPDNLSQY